MRKLDESSLDVALDEKYADLASFVSQHPNVTDIVKKIMSSLEINTKQQQLDRITKILERIKKSSQATPAQVHQSCGNNAVQWINQHNQGTVLQMVNTQNVPQSSTGADAQPNPSTHLNVAPTVADPVAAHTQLPQQPENSQVQKIRLQTPTSETLDKYAKLSDWAVDFLRKKPPDIKVRMNALKDEFFQAFPECYRQVYERTLSNYVHLKSLVHAAGGTVKVSQRQNVS